MPLNTILDVASFIVFEYGHVAVDGGRVHAYLLVRGFPPTSSLRLESMLRLIWLAQFTLSYRKVLLSLQLMILS